jgi:predicted ATPase
VTYALFYQAVVHWGRGDARAQRECAAEVIALGETYDVPLYLGLGHVLNAAARSALGVAPDALREAVDGVALAARTENQGGAPSFFAFLAEIHAAGGQLNEAIGVLDTGLAVAAGTGQPFFDAELNRLKGELLIAAQPGSEAESEGLFRRALGIARAQGAHFLELRAATGLARLLRSAGRVAEARATLAPVHGWFSEGFDTRDLLEAAALLGELR